MKEVVRVMEEHGNLFRYDSGFWSWSGVEIHKTKNGADTFDVPVWWCGVRTLRALAKRGVVKLDEENKSCQLI